MRHTAFPWFACTLIVGLVFSVAPAAASEDSAIAQWPAYKSWVEAWDRAGGDRNVAVKVQTSRVYVTERVGASGVVRIDLIGGDVDIEIKGLNRVVDVWLLDNKPGPGKSIVPEDGDVLIRLGTLFPAKSAVSRHQQAFGPGAFRGLEVDWILVSDAGVHPAESRLLFGARHSFEKLYTRARLTREGFPPEVPPGKLLSESMAPASAKNVSQGAQLPVAGAVPMARRPDRVLVDKGLVSVDVFDGGFTFFHQQFAGNGRTCGTCHPQANNQTIDVPFIESLPNSDRLFVAEQVEALAELEIPDLMRNFGLILENVDGFQAPTERFVMRGVPHSLSLATSITRPTGDPNPPEDRTGWSGDGAPNPGSLKEFLFGAIFQHLPKTLARQFPNDFRMPTEKELAKTEEFSLNSGRLFDVDIHSMSLTEPRADNGRVLFGDGNHCDQCHNDAGANIGGSNPNINTAVEMLVNPAQGFNGITFPLDGGFGGPDEMFPNFDCDGDLVDDCFGDGEFNVTPVIEAADTPPFFHNNVVQTVEGSVQFYNGRFGINFSLADINDVGAFMRVINAAFNFQIAIQRVEAALIIDPEADNAPSHAKFVAIRGTANRLLDLACAEIEDALDVLGNSPIGALNPSSIGAGEKAKSELEDAIRSTSTAKRQTLMLSARQFLISADDGLGTGMDYLLGQGNLLF